MSSDSKSILIIGGGVIGLSTAYYCARRGHRVTLIDRNPEQRDGCSFGNAGMVVPSHFVPLAAPGAVSTALKWMFNPESPLYIKPRPDWELMSWGWKFMRASNAKHVERSAPLIRDLSFASRACFDELEALPNNDFGLVKKGLVMLCKTQESLDHEGAFAKQANDLGVPAEVLDAKALGKLDPDVTMDVAGGVYFPKDCHLSPNRFMAGLKRQCDAMGVKFVWGTEVSDFTQHGSRVSEVSTSSGKFTADEVILCGGSWSPVVGEELGLKLPMQAGKGYSLTVTKPRQLPQLCSIFTEARVAVTPMGDTLRFGGTMEIAGLNEDINPVRVQGIIKAVPKYFPKFTPDDFANIKPWRGLRPCSPDGMPYLGRTSKFTNLTIATGHAMMGLSLGPITGKLVSEIISGEKPSLDLTLLNPDRYA
ncbi:MAG: FAD-dependent oxidoreductase [Verrucomicrobia bacterium]|nr:FAD-dependent oxidoreductase [Verrucomicrobiota bacterium]